MQLHLTQEAGLPTETKKQYFQRLVSLTQAGHSLAHQWEWSGKQSLIKCVKCSRWMSLSRSWEHVHAISQPCVNDAVPSLPNKLKIHASHAWKGGPAAGSVNLAFLGCLMAVRQHMPINFRSLARHHWPNILQSKGFLRPEASSRQEAIMLRKRRVSKKRSFASKVRWLDPKNKEPETKW